MYKRQIWFRYLLEPSTDTIWHLWLGEGFFQWFDAWLKPSGINDGWDAASFPCLVFLLLAVPVAASSFRLPRYAPGGGRPFSWSLFYEHFHQLGKLWKNRNLRVSEMGITVLVVTHEHELVRRFNRRTITLKHGRIISDVPASFGEEVHV